MRLISHILVGLLIGMIYFDIGDDASKVYNNSGCIFVMLLFLMFTAMMPTILTCKLSIQFVRYSTTRKIVCLCCMSVGCHYKNMYYHASQLWVPYSYFSFS